jgi:hypothetical protein
MRTSLVQNWSKQTTILAATAVFAAFTLSENLQQYRAELQTDSTSPPTFDTRFEGIRMGPPVFQNPERAWEGPEDAMRLKEKMEEERRMKEMMLRKEDEWQSADQATDYETHESPSTEVQPPLHEQVLPSMSESSDMQPVLNAVMHLLRTVEAQCRNNSMQRPMEDVSTMIHSLQNRRPTMEKEDRFQDRAPDLQEKLDSMFAMAGRLIREAEVRGIVLQEDALSSFEKALQARAETDTPREKVFEYFRIMEKVIMKQAKTDAALAGLIEGMKRSNNPEKDASTVE